MKKQVSFILIAAILIAIIPYATAQGTITCTVTLKFHQYINEHHVGPNNTLEGTLYGNITCEIDAQNYEYRYVKVRVTSEYTEDWGPTRSHEYIFTESGTQRFALTYTIHDDCRNGTINKITVKGTWQVERYGSSKLESKGDAEPDQCKLIVYRPEVPRIMITSTGGEPVANTQSFLDAMGGPCVIAIIAVPAAFLLLLAFTIVMIVKKVKKKKAARAS